MDTFILFYYPQNFFVEVIYMRLILFEQSISNFERVCVIVGFTVCGFDLWTSDQVLFCVYVLWQPSHLAL